MASYRHYEDANYHFGRDLKKSSNFLDISIDKLAI